MYLPITNLIKSEDNMLDVNTAIVTSLCIFFIILAVSAVIMLTVFMTLRLNRLQASNYSETTIKHESGSMPLNSDRLARARSELTMYVLKALSNSKS